MDAEIARTSPVRLRRSHRGGLGAVVAIAVALVLVASGCVINGTWAATPPPTVPGMTLLDVSCVGEDWCLAVGSSSSTPAVQAWDGDSWAASPAPPGGSLGGVVLSITCGAPDRCLASVLQNEPVWPVTYLMGWDGSAWSYPQPKGPIEGGGVAWDCVAAGCVISDDIHDTTSIWDGTATTVVASGPDQVTWSRALSCTSTSDCIGWDATTTDRWDGTGWTRQTVSLARFPRIEDIECHSSTSSCVAVGYSLASGTPQAAFAASWDGTTWTPHDAPSATSTHLTDVSCGSPTECVALGEPSGWGAPSAFSVETWNGEDWFAAPAPPGGSAAGYRGVSCEPLWCMAVGLGSAPVTTLSATYTWTND